MTPPTYSEEQEHVLEGESLSPPLTPTKPVPRERERLPSTYIKRKRTIYTAGSLYTHTVLLYCMDAVNEVVMISHVTPWKRV